MDGIEEIGKSLSNDVLAKILLLPSLSVRSLLRCKSVCKQWRDLISDPAFVKLHLNLAYYNHTVSQIHMSPLYPINVRPLPFDDEKFQPSDTSPDRPWYVTLSPFSSDIDAVRLGEPVNGVPLRLLSVYGSCNGLLLIATDDRSFLWNPLISDQVELPGKSYIWDMDPLEESCITGLGYNSVLDEYKAVVVVADHDESYLAKFGCQMTQIYVYNSRIGYWKELHPDFRYDISACCQAGITVNGFPHWVIDEYKDNVRDYKIMFFDTVDDAFKVLPTPIEWCCEYNKGRNFICTWGTCLSAWHQNDKFTSVAYDVWIMKEHSVEESWTKLPVVPFSLNCPFTNNVDEVTVQIDFEEIVPHNRKIEEDIFAYGTSIPFNGGSWLKSYGYVGSLVSPCNLRKGGERRKNGT